MLSLCGPNSEAIRVRCRETPNHRILRIKHLGRLKLGRGTNIDKLAVVYPFGTVGDLRYLLSRSWFNLEFWMYLTQMLICDTLTANSYRPSKSTGNQTVLVCQLAVHHYEDPAVSASVVRGLEHVEAVDRKTSDRWPFFDQLRSADGPSPRPASSVARKRPTALALKRIERTREYISG